MQPCLSAELCAAHRWSPRHSPAPGPGARHRGHPRPCPARGDSPRPIRATTCPRSRSSVGPLALRVTYPARRHARSRRRIRRFCWAAPGAGDAELTINGAPVQVWPNGGWIAWVALPPDSLMRLELRARTPRDTAVLVHEVRRAACVRAARPAAAVWIDTTSLTPRGRVWAAPANTSPLSRARGAGSRAATPAARHRRRSRLPCRARRGGVVPFAADPAPDTHLRRGARLRIGYARARRRRCATTAIAACCGDAPSVPARPRASGGRPRLRRGVGRGTHPLRSRRAMRLRVRLAPKRAEPGRAPLLEAIRGSRHGAGGLAAAGHVARHDPHGSGAGRRSPPHRRDRQHHGRPRRARRHLQLVLSRRAPAPS